MGHLTDLTGDDWARIAGAIEDSTNPEMLERLLKQRFRAVHREVSFRGGFADVVHQVTQRANELGVLDAVLVALSATRPALRPLLTAY